MTITNTTAFRASERKYKQRSRKLDFSDVLHFRVMERNSEDNKKRIRAIDAFDLDSYATNIFIPPSKWQAYQVDGIPGLTFIVNPFQASAQRRLCREALVEYTRPPNKTSLDAHYHVPPSGIFELFRSERLFGTTTHLDPKPFVDPSKEGEEKHVFVAKGPHTPSYLMQQLRWVTLGYQYNWYTKQYVFENPVAVPKLLEVVTKDIVRACGPSLRIRVNAEGNGKDMEGDEPEKYCARRRVHQTSETIATNEAPQTLRGLENSIQVGFRKEYVPQAGIVNFYQVKDSLTAHVDRSEINMEAPLVSLSFGHSCIFLIGGPTRDQKPDAILIESGDVVVLSAEARRAFHGVPRILEGTSPSYLTDPNPLESESDQDQTVLKLCAEFMGAARVNINLRQVLF